MAVVAADSGALALEIVVVVALVVPVLVLGVVVWIFWRAKKREDAERGRS